MSDAALMHAPLNCPPLSSLGLKVSSRASMGKCLGADSLGFLDDAPPRGVKMCRSPTSPLQPHVQGRLEFAHSVTPHISNIGRQLASQYAVNFDSCRRKAPSQELASHDLELLCSPRQEMDQ